MNGSSVNIGGIDKAALVNAFMEKANYSLDESGGGLLSELVPNVRVATLTGATSDLVKTTLAEDTLPPSIFIKYEDLVGKGSVSKIVAEVRKDPANMTTPPKVKAGLFGNLMKRVGL